MGEFSELNAVEIQIVTINPLIKDKPSIEINFAKKINEAVYQAKGKYIFLIHENIKIISKGWLTGLLEQAQRDEIGIVGPKILFSRRLIYSAGIVMKLKEIPFGHVFHNTEDVNIYHSNVTKNYLALSELCFLITKAKFLEAGGYDETFTGILCHLDFCLKLHDLGFRNVYIPFTTVYNQSPSETTMDPKQVNTFTEKWLKLLESDPYYSPHFSKERADFTL